MDSVDFIRNKLNKEKIFEDFNQISQELKSFLINNSERFQSLYQEKYLDIMNTCYFTILEQYDAPYDELTTFIKKVLQIDPDQIPPQVRNKLSQLKSYHNIRKLIQNHIPIQAEEVISEKHLTPQETAKKEQIAKALKSHIPYLKQKYGDDWKEMMYKIATANAIKAESLEEDFKGISTKELIKHVESHGWSKIKNGKEHDSYGYFGNESNKPKYKILIPRHSGNVATGLAKKLYDQAIPKNFEIFNKKIGLSEELNETDKKDKRKGHFKVTFDDGTSTVIHNAHDPEDAQEIAKKVHGKEVTEVNTFYESNISETFSIIKEVVKDSIKNQRKNKNSKDAEITLSGGTTMTKQKRNTIHINPRVKTTLDNDK